MEHPGETSGATPNRPPLVSLERLTVLIDGVFAITLTLLVLDLRPPDVPASALASGLASMLPRLAAYLVSFYTIANQWSIHVRVFALVKRADGRLVWLSIANLLFVTLLPASTALLGQFPFEPLAAVCYSVNSLLMSLSVAAIWLHVYRERPRLAAGADPLVLSGIARVWLFVSAGFIVAIPLAFVSNLISIAVWIGWPFLVSQQWFRYRRKLIRAGA